MQRGRPRSTDRRPRSTDRRRWRSRGQTLVEFALVLPLFMLILMAVVEFGFLFNSFLAINFASREASLVAAEAGNLARADCLILNAVEQSVSAPADRGLITTVDIFRADRAGNESGIRTTYSRGGGTTSCTLPGGGTLSVPYVVDPGSSYPPLARCPRLAGCQAGQVGVDQVGVKVTYEYGWHTPLGSIFGGSSATTTLVKSNIMRMEPVL